MNERPAKEIFRDPPRVETGRLILRAMTVKDEADMYEYSSNPDTVRYLLWDCHPSPSYTRAYLSYIAGQYEAGRFFDWAVEEKESKKMIGTGGFTVIDDKNRLAQIGYVLNPAFWGRGYGTEIAKELLAFGFSYLGLHRIEALYMPGNDRSTRVMEKCGMTFEGIARGAMFVKGEFRDVGKYAILDNEYFAAHERKIYSFDRVQRGIRLFGRNR